MMEPGPSLPLKVKIAKYLARLFPQWRPSSRHQARAIGSSSCCAFWDQGPARLVFVASVPFFAAIVSLEVHPSH
jgi:hypothetical protein